MSIMMIEMTTQGDWNLVGGSTNSTEKSGEHTELMMMLMLLMMPMLMMMLTMLMMMDGKWSVRVAWVSRQIR